MSLKTSYMFFLKQNFKTLIALVSLFFYVSSSFGQNDFGDLPLSYEEDAGGVVVPAQNIVSPDLFFGTQPDSEAGPQSVALGADNNGINGDGLDEDGATPAPIIGGAIYTIPVIVTNTTGSTGRLRAWIDFNNDGEFGSTETVSVSVPNGSVGATVNLTTLSIGEVEDYRVSVPAFKDFGDAPLSFEEDLLGIVLPAQNLVSSSLFMGTQPDIETGPQSVVLGANNNGTNGDGLDEDGAIPPGIAVGDDYNLSVSVTNSSGAAASLRGWIDVNGNGHFEESEGVTANVPNGISGTINLLWPASITGFLCDTAVYMRLRLQPGTYTTSSGVVDEAAIADGVGGDLDAIAIGEVEDYRISVVEIIADGCFNSDFTSNSFNDWAPFTGVFGDRKQVYGEVTGRHTIITTPGFDLETNSGLSVLPPGGSVSCRLGNSNNGSESEALTYDFIVGPENESFTYSFVLVLQEPGHSPADQPFFTTIIEVDGVPLSGCGFYSVFAGEPGSTFQPGEGEVIWTDWKKRTVDLSAYQGSHAKITFITADCGFSAHFGYAHLSVECEKSQLVSGFCDASGPATIAAPEGYDTYLWSPGGETTSTIEVATPNNGDVYSVTMQSIVNEDSESCPLTLDITLQLIDVNADFSIPNLCNTPVTSFVDLSTANNDDISNCEWDFGNGNSSNLQNPDFAFTPAVNHNVQLIASTAGGCVDTTDFSFNCSVILSVELTAFTATPNYDRMIVDLDWSTETEHSNDYFEILRSPDMENWTPIGMVDGAGNSNELINYHFEDSDPEVGENYYRLNQVDYDGAETLSEIKAAYFTSDNILFFPNPAKDKVTFFLKDISSYNFSWSDQQGRSIRVVPTYISDDEMEVNLANVADGIYYIVFSNNFETKMMKLIVSK
jgi:hypothetical protein